ncbi:hypothetical protein N0V83_006647 [Neocucurbitaria cava]|uniref:Uncharacterized protein n=1 Tax=Neocucurbitaria cava TaxID=798079 RepID=A0A9W8Y8F1_9PLEO|nr:hypothetical protein N0V83_006647 [Neocucurbitaria cava]
MNKTPSEEEIASTLSHLELSTKVPQKPAHKPKSKPVADSWDEDISGSDTETEEAPKSSSASTRDSLEPISTVPSLDLSPHPPPPTPASPSAFDYPNNFGGRTPKRTEEEREYDRAMKEKERKRRTEEKERESREAAEREARKKAVWDD